MCTWGVQCTTHCCRNVQWQKAKLKTVWVENIKKDSSARQTVNMGFFRVKTVCLDNLNNLDARKISSVFFWMSWSFLKLPYSWVRRRKKMAVDGGKSHFEWGRHWSPTHLWEGDSHTVRQYNCTRRSPTVVDSKYRIPVESRIPGIRTHAQKNQN